MSSVRFVLGSGSPRRQELLGSIGVRFTIRTPDIDESVREGESAEAYVRRLSLEKAKTVLRHETDAVVLAADTTVALGDRILGKPETRLEGIEMLSALSGTTHEVLTSVSVVSRHQEATICISSEVRFRTVSTSEMNWYWESGEPLDKAGGYGLQGIGAAFVSEINGSHTNVIGLPLAETVQVLRQFGVPCLGETDQTKNEYSKIQDESYV